MIATLFDFNGVIADDEHLHLACFRAALQPLGVSVSDEVYKERYLGFDDQGAFAAMLKDAGREASDALVKSLIAAKKPLYMARAKEELRIFPGAKELLLHRAARGPVGIVSGALMGEIASCLGVLGVADRVLFIVSAEQTRASKPDPEGYRLAMDRLAREGVHEAVVIEDSIAGVQAAKGASLRCAAVTNTYARAELLAAGADVVVSALGELSDAALEGR